MRYLITLIAFLALVGCGNQGTATAPAPAAPVELSVVQRGPVATYPVQQFDVPQGTKITATQPALGWLPRWSITGGTLAVDPADATIMTRIVTPSGQGPCVVTIEWYEIAAPPPPPAVG